VNPVGLDRILGILEELAPPDLAEGWDNVGLMVGSPADPISGILVSLDATEEAVLAARQTGANLLLTHHPLLFKPLSAVNPSEPTGAVVVRAIQEKVAILAAHTNLDSAQGGVNDVLAGLLGLERTRPLVPSPDHAGAGLGRLGEFEQSRTLGETAQMVKKALGVEAVRVVGSVDRPIRRVAVCGGSGGDLVSPAKAAGAELLLTGEIAHHRAREAEFLGLALIEAGHYATEIPVIPVLAGRIEKALNTAGVPLVVSNFEGEWEPFKPF
jgi:dinuclear metal center YbgI/SA1388 family protein